mmetsp:Transcript_65892/g.190086  ORF Transcript_65892/g.190086 Transcript_65892/m.190086 type:complete len:631 (-) Transcript_65892:210-2102(-)|eukprot:CAMPEP_0176056798 /NCGR_PEP_ID=MMETSP0120_2-20121206/28286_1 /TAXON_ID=160619 /ORGANISM="Kryptoperidinium foliaceum, Strain CCMP 1326" /LENGTH=630 /DNA_ID=CAMNT_0017390305 /DNA_START=39 /DNA_END=1931 /DNA_ORIENTATION=+
MAVGKLARVALVVWPVAFASAANDGNCSVLDPEEGSMLQVSRKQAPDDVPWPAPDGIPSPYQIQAARARAKTGQELTEPEVLKPPYKLTLQETFLPTPWLGGGFNTRAYGSVPGPTIRIKPGELLEIEYENKLPKGAVSEEACDPSFKNTGYFMNMDAVCRLDHSNLHTHGLHVSGDDPDGDNILRIAKPGETIKYKIKVPENHMPGTHWYHPHLHHATSAQAGGGAHGAIIVDDPKGYLPTEIEDMPEKLCFLSLVNPAKSMRLEAWGLSKHGSKLAEQKFWKNTVYKDWEWDPISGPLVEKGIFRLDPQLVVNGQFLPKLTLPENTWYRLRMVYASVEQRSEILLKDGSENGGATCEFQLLAKDGIYLHTAPRSVSRLVLASGSRADVAVRCSCQFSLMMAATGTCKAWLWYNTFWQPQSDIGSPDTFDVSSDYLMSFVVERAPRPIVQLPVFQVRRPCYLVDLRHATIEAANKHELFLHQTYPMSIEFDGQGEIWQHKTPAPLGELPVGTLQEWRISGVDMHPAHMHIIPYQIMHISDSEYYQPGDWHDTISPAAAHEVTVRLNLDTFTGMMIMHCHILEHEDNGMMGWFKTVGVEGTHYPGNEKLDPTCYNGDFPGPVSSRTVQWR